MFRKAAVVDHEAMPSGLDSSTSGRIEIVFPVVGEVAAAGLTVQQLTERLQEGLQAELKRPRVTVSLKEINKGLLRRVSVFGAVNR